MKNKITPTDVEKVMRESDFIVSKTDPKGRILYGNRIFIEYSGYSEAELIGAQHNIIRHPDMPRGVFKLLWDTIQRKQECFAYVKNMAKDGSFYWVLAHITPDLAADGSLEGFTSVRRKPNPEAVRKFAAIYKEMLAIEAQAGAKDACIASMAHLDGLLATSRLSYPELIFSTL